MVIGFSFPICPAGIVRVNRVPCALTPAIVCVPKSSCFRLLSVISRCFQCSILPLIASFIAPFISPNRFPICSAVLVSGCRMKFAFATGSLMNTNDFGSPEVASGPIAGSVTSLRKRPWLSRKRFVWVFREMRLPSASVCVVSETATALNGAPVTTFPPCIPSKPSSSMRSPMGPATQSPPGPPCSMISACGGGGGGACCAPANPVLNPSAPQRIKLMPNVRFIILSPLLSRTVANSLSRRFPQRPLSAARSMPQTKLVALAIPTEPRVLFFPKTLFFPSLRPSPQRGSRGFLIVPALLRQPHRLRQSVISNEQIHLYPFTGALFIYGQTQRAQGAALHAHAQNRSLIGICRQNSWQQREIVHFVVRQKRFRFHSFRRVRPPRSTCTLHWRLMVLHPAAVIRRKMACTGRCQMHRCFFLLALSPISPAQRADQNRCCGQRPGRNYGRSPHLQGAMLRAELLAQPHLHAGRGLGRGGVLGEGPQLNASRLPGILQGCAARTGADMLLRRRALDFIARSVALGVQSNRFKFFARHFALPSRCITSFTAPRSRAAADPAVSRAWPSAEPARDAAASESFRWDSRPFSRPPRNSSLPARTKPPLRETPGANPAPRSSLARSARAFPPTSPAWMYPARQSALRFRFRSSPQAILPAASVPGVSSPGFALCHKGMPRGFRARRRISLAHASRS